MTSQFFANVYLNGLDHFIKRKLGCQNYLRYMDDFAIFHGNKRFLWSAKEKIVQYLVGLHLQLHENKCRIFETKHGTPFLGITVLPDRLRLKRQNVIRFKRRLKRFQKLYAEDCLEWKRINQSIQSWIGHASHADTVKLRNDLLPEVVFRRQKGD